MSARLSTLARRWNVNLLTVQEYCHASDAHHWSASAVDDSLPRSRPDAMSGCLLITHEPTREAALFLLKAAIDEARKPLQVAA